MPIDSAAYAVAAKWYGRENLRSRGKLRDMFVHSGRKVCARPAVKKPNTVHHLPPPTEAIPEIAASRCLLSRWKDCSCDICVTKCPWNAIEIQSQQALIERKRCVKCMHCIAVCPAGAIVGNELPIEDLIQQLACHQRPVIGCRQKPHNAAHARVGCVGYLSQDILFALGVRIGKPLQISAISCASCSAGAVVEGLKESLSRLKSMMPAGVRFQIKLIERDEELHFEHRRISRRDFFRQIPTDIRSKSRKVLDSLDDLNTPSYGAKVLPEHRAALNKALAVLDPLQGDMMLSRRYYDLKVAASCNDCRLCVGLCPTGALAQRKVGKPTDPGLRFNTLLCSGCGLCKEACPKKAITIQMGFPGISSNRKNMGE